MKPERWQRIEAIYHEASALAVDERAAYLREACGDDPALLAEVRSLLDEDYASRSSTRRLPGRRSECSPARCG